jgi:hypothetical protein
MCRDVPCRPRTLHEEAHGSYGRWGSSALTLVRPYAAGGVARLEPEAGSPIRWPWCVSAARAHEPVQSQLHAWAPGSCQARINGHVGEGESTPSRAANRRRGERVSSAMAGVARSAPG